MGAEMANLFMYTLLFAADLAIIGFVTHYFVKTLHWHMPSYAPQSTAPTLEKLKINGYYLIVLMGVGLALYGALIFLFSWMPRQWVNYDEDGDPIWVAQWLASLGAFFGAFALLGALEKAPELQKQISRLQDHVTKAEAFNKLIRREIDQYSWITRMPETDRQNSFVRLDREIDEAKIFAEDARVCRDLLRILRETVPASR